MATASFSRGAVAGIRAHHSMEVCRAEQDKAHRGSSREGRGSGWELARQGDASPMSTYRTQDEAARAGRRTAKREQTEFVLKGRNGRIRDRSSYGSDPQGRG